MENLIKAIDELIVSTNLLRDAVDRLDVDLCNMWEQKEQNRKYLEEMSIEDINALFL